MKFSTLILLIVGVTAISIHNQAEESSGLESLKRRKWWKKAGKTTASVLVGRYFLAEEGNDEDVDFDALSPEEKAAWVFKKFDTNENKELTWREIKTGLSK